MLKAAIGKLILLAGAILCAQPAFAANDPVPSKCMAIAQAVPGVTLVGLTTTAIDTPEVTITFAGHSTYVIETPGGVTIATDFSGWAGPGVMPGVITMNKAHSTHYTDFPDPGIAHVLRGWNPEGGPARHALTIEDVYIRNVPTDIRSGFMAEKDGNSIFVFEVADLCIGHLGHLHHALDDSHYAAIGRLDIVMVPVDGGLTLSHDEMTEITRRLQSSIVLPMHRRGAPMQQFITMMGSGFAVDYRDERSFTVSLRTLPRRPTILILGGV